MERVEGEEVEPATKSEDDDVVPERTLDGWSALSACMMEFDSIIGMDFGVMERADLDRPLNFPSKPPNCHDLGGTD